MRSTIAILSVLGCIVVLWTSLGPFLAPGAGSSEPPRQAIHVGPPSSALLGVPATRPSSSSCSNCVIKTLAVGKLPSGLSLDPKTGDLFVGNYGGNNVTVIDTHNDTVVGSFKVGQGTRDVLYVGATGKLYVDLINSLTGIGTTMAVVDAKSGTVVSTVKFNGTDPIFPCYDASNGNLYVPLHYTNILQVVNTTTNKITSTIPIGAYAGSATCDPANGDIYVANQNSGNVTVINGSTNRAIANVPIGPNTGPYGTLYDPANGEIYVGDSGTNSNGYRADEVNVLSTTSNRAIANITTNFNPLWFAYDSSNKDIYTTEIFSSDVSIINGSTNRIIGSIPVGANPTAVLYDSANRELYIANELGDSVSVINVAGPAWATSLTAPSSAGMNGTAYRNLSGSTVGCGATISVGQAPGLNRRYDYVDGNVSVGLAACGGAGGVATYIAKVGVGHLNFSVPANRSYNLSFEYGVRGPLVRLAIGAPSSASGTLQAAFALSVHESIVDWTTGRSIVQTASRGVENWSMTPSARHVAPTAFLGELTRLNVPLVTGQTYGFVLWFTFTLSVSATPACPVGSTAAVDLSMTHAGTSQGTAAAFDDAQVSFG